MKLKSDKKRVWLVGHTGLVGSALKRRLIKEDLHILTSSRSEVNLLNQHDVCEWVFRNAPDIVIMCAGKVGGIKANIESPYDFLYENTTILSNVINASHKNNIEKFINISSSCIYPRESKCPIKEDSIGIGCVEPTNEGYAYSKIVGLKLCETLAKQFNKNFFSLIPTNLYGPNDNFNLKTAHVPAALIKKFHKAKVNNEEFVQVWGSGKAIREFLHVDDFADACLYILKNYTSVKPINVGTGKGITIKSFAHIIRDIVGFKGKIIFGNENLDGMPSKVLDTTKLETLGWSSRISLKNGLEDFYKWFVKNETKNNLINFPAQEFSENCKFLKNITL
jgi:GDP-L-fucose synthase|tara:strand:+ start:2133 stop:3140 length:1008 start_codon:yes stop_codon:yes gene_type:complete